MGSLKHKTSGGKMERDVISSSIEVAPGTIVKGTSTIKDFSELVEVTMREKGFGGREVSGADLAVREIIPDALNYCEPCTLTAQANISTKGAMIKFAWRQAEGADLAEIERVREAELKALMALDDPEAYGNSLFARIEDKEAEGKLGGVGQGLFLVKSFCDDLTSYYDPSTHTMLVIAYIENKGRKLSPGGGV